MLALISAVVWVQIYINIPLNAIHKADFQGSAHSSVKCIYVSMAEIWRWRKSGNSSVDILDYQRGNEKFFGTFISFFRTFISFFRSFIWYFRSFIWYFRRIFSFFRGYFWFPRELLGNSSGDVGLSEDVWVSIALWSQVQSTYPRVVVKCSL